MLPPLALRVANRLVIAGGCVNEVLVLRGGSGAGLVGGGTESSIASLIINRGFWLGIFLLSLSLTSVVMSGFEHTLAEHIELAYFVPLLIGHGGNAGGQTVGTVLGGLSAGQLQLCAGRSSRTQFHQVLDRPHGHAYEISYAAYEISYG